MEGKGKKFTCQLVFHDEPPRRLAFCVLSLAQDCHGGKTQVTLTGQKQMGAKPAINHRGRDRDTHTCPWMPTDDRQRRSFAACCVNLRGTSSQLISYAVVHTEQTWVFFSTQAARKM